ncbi:MAG: hypothetical protein HFJ45_08655 [Clostridia bacterium]|nr:hypothetical protein [Clostridia bacterium]
MKVLFAVSNESISEAIIKRYPKEYRELLSYKNVYYFNAILKEIQNDKTYDRIVISEDLEPFVNTNNDSIDNFIFEHLDKISDEAQGNDGKEVSIILICSERRTLGSSILNKLFSIGIYNALIGNDRNMTELCKLINRPRTKKEAKLYYRIDQANYDPAGDTGEVSEIEIQSILNHFKKLGKNTERYADSFNNIAAQYTDEQLRLIANVLPMKVKAVLEAESQKYQALMGTTGPVKQIREIETTVEPGIKVNTIGKGSNINGPIVIPSSVRKISSKTQQVASVSAVPQTKGVQPQLKQRPVQQVQAQNKVQNQADQANVVKVQRKPITQNQVQVQKQQSVQQVSKEQAQVQQIKQQTQKPQQMSQMSGNIVPQNVNKVKTASQDKVSSEVKPTQRYTGVISQVKKTISPNISENKVKENSVIQDNNTNNDLTALLDGLETNQPVSNQPEVLVQERRGRGRPRKPVSEVEVPKPKGKRGRPRKNVISAEENELNNLLNPVEVSEDEMLSGLNDVDILPGMEEDVDVLPGMEEDVDVLPGMEEDTDILPGMEEDADILPGMEEDADILSGMEEDADILPGMEEDADILSGMEEDADILPGMEDDADILPGMEEDADILPGMEEDVDVLPGMEDDGDVVDVSSLLAGLDDENSEELPGLNDEQESDTLPGFEDSLDSDTENENDLLSDLDEEETVLPGMGFEDEGLDNDFSTPKGAVSQNAIESIKPKIDYSMSNLNSLLSKDKKIVTFLGATKNGTSFLVNNLALMFSLMGIDTAILDMTQNRNSYYIFTDSREELRNIAYTSINKLESGYAEGIKFNKNLTVYTALPADGNTYENAEPILSTLVQNHSLVLIDCDFTTPPAYFASCQEIYLVQSMDILTIQPLTAFIRDLKFKGAWEPEKARVVINKEIPIKVLNNKMIIGGMSRYNGPDMSVMTDLFNKDMVKACSIPFDEKVYGKYLETMATCKLSLNGYSKQFMSKLQVLGEMVYPRLNGKKSYEASPKQGFGNGGMNSGNAFSSSTNSTLNKMKSKY